MARPCARRPRASSKRPDCAVEAGEADECGRLDHSRALGSLQDRLCPRGRLGDGQGPVVQRHRQAHESPGRLALVAGTLRVDERLFERLSLLAPVVDHPLDVRNAAPGLREAELVSESLELREGLLGNATELLDPLGIGQGVGETLARGRRGAPAADRRKPRRRRSLP